MDSAAGSGSRADVRVEELYGNSGSGSSNRTGVYGGGGELGHRMHGDGASSQEWSAALPADMQAQIMHLQQQHQQQQQAMHVFSDANLMSEASSDPLVQPQRHAAPLQNYHYQPHLSPDMHQHHQQQQQHHQQQQQHHHHQQQHHHHQQQHQQQQQYSQHVPQQHLIHDHHQQPQHFDGRQPYHQNTAATMHATYQGSDLYNPLGQPERMGNSSIARTNGIGSLASSTANSSPVVVQQAQPSQHVHHASAHLEPMLQNEATAAATSVPHYGFPLDNSLDAYSQRPPTSGSALHQQHHGIPQGIKAEAPVEGFEMGWQGANEARGSTSLGDHQQNPALSHQHHTLHSGADHASAFFSAASDGQSGSAGLSVIHTPHQQQLVAAQYNYTDHVLSAALASNAHISASAPSSDNGTANESASALLPSPHYFPAASNISLTDARGNATPTIKEEEEGEDAFRRHQQAFAGIHHHHHDAYDAGSAAKTSPFTERPHPLQHHHSTGHLPSAHQQPFQPPAHPTHHFHHSMDYAQQQTMHAHEYASQPDEGHAFVPSFPASHGGDSGGMGMGIDGIHHLGDANNTGMPAVASHSLTRRTKPYLRPTIYQQYTNINAAAMEERAQDMGGDCLSFIDDVIFNYISTPSRLGLGERTVMIMTSKVAQKSYGAEKRFLCPPPMVLLVGSSWWSACHRSADGMVTGGTAGSVASFSGPFQQLGNGGAPSDESNDDSIEPTILIPPRLGIAMGGEGSTSQQEGVLEWAASSGKLIDTDNPSSEFAISGRSIGRQLFISDTDEKRRHCEALVQISVPAMGSSDRRTLGVFASKPIKVISKPSKKRQSTRNSELGVQHGSTISLFHRLRAQTVSTRYLCVSGAPTWFKGSDGNPFLNTDANTHIPNQGESPSCFVAKTSSWDPFIVYLVDPHTKSPGSAKTSSEGNGHVARDAPPQRQGKDASGKAGEGRPAHYPSPPINALPFAHGGTAIHYNQPVVLQCLNTAVVSPIMVIRKADRGTTVVGSGQPLMPLDPRSPPSGDTYGEPVSQLHKVAFEILEEPQGFDGTASGDAAGPGVSGHFLGCLNEDVGLRKPLGPRQWAASGGSSRPTTPMTPMTPSMANMSSSPSFGSDGTFKTEQMMSPAYNVAGMQGRFTAASQQQQQQDCAADGGKAKRPRRVSSSVLVQRGERTATSGSGAGSGAVSAAAAARSRRRGQSLSVVGLQNQLQAQQQQHGNSTGFSASMLSPPASAMMVGIGGNSGIVSSASMGAMPMSGSSGGASAANQQLLRRTSSFGNSLASDVSSLGMMPLNEGGVWTVDVHDSDVWTIVGVDIARHTFYLPPKLVNGVKANARGVDDSIAHLVTVPAPANPITPIPIVHRLSGGPRGDGGGGTTGSGSGAVTPAEYVTLIGENLSKDLFIFFGDWRSTHVTVTDRNTIRCAPPPALDDMGVARGRVPITLVRRDGVIFPSDCIYHT